MPQSDVRAYKSAEWTPRVGVHSALSFLVVVCLKTLAGGNANRFAVHGDGVTRVQLPAAAFVDLAVDLHQAVLDEFGGLNTVVNQAGQLKQLSQADHVVADGDVNDLL